ncbi:MAG: sulfatase-like hydrolase/transferase [Deltaproteobacteria bacterium]|nr:sulfatase-like hydrolase/transferase [Deltaproteobacteria bacterium]
MPRISINPLWVAALQSMLLTVAAGCTSPGVVVTLLNRPSNILVVIADDVGVDKTAAYGEHADPPPTPNLTALAERGVLFTRAFAYPKCSPTRAGVLTGRYGFHYGIGDHLLPGHRWELSLEEVTVPRMLDEGTAGLYAHSAVGKWHLGGRGRGSIGPIHPVASGFTYHAGALGNLAAHVLPHGREQSYFHFKKAEMGELYIEHEYATRDTTNDAIARIQAMPEPWFLWVAYNAAHSPYHAPPPDLNSDGVTDEDPISARYDAMVGSIDLEMGHLFQSMGSDLLDRTVIVFMGDNGTPPEVKTGREAGRPGKETLYEGGIRVPLIIAGPPVRLPGGRTDGLVNHTDLFATVAEIAGADLELSEESVSLLPYLDDPDLPSLREVVFAERFLPNGPGPYDEVHRMVRDERWKLITHHGGDDELYDLREDPLEAKNLASSFPDGEAQDAHTRLRMEMRAILSVPW